MNPFFASLAGQRSFLSVPEAAAVIVKAGRYHLQTFFGVPSADAIERGVRFSRDAKDAWIQGGGRLASTLNYALVRTTYLTTKVVGAAVPVSTSNCQARTYLKICSCCGLTVLETKAGMQRVVALGFDAVPLNGAYLEVSTNLCRVMPRQRRNPSPASRKRPPFSHHGHAVILPIFRRHRSRL